MLDLGNKKSSYQRKLVVSKRSSHLALVAAAGVAAAVAGAGASAAASAAASASAVAAAVGAGSEEMLDSELRGMERVQPSHLVKS